MEEKTIKQYNQVIGHCRELFEKKAKDYGTAWRIMRMPSITDQIYIKINRIRSIQDKGQQQVNEAIEDEFVAIINYSLIAMIQISLEGDDRIEIPADELMKLYDQFANETLELLQRKNHDYGEAWRDMRVSSITDIILMKVYRVKQIEDNEGHTLVSEGVKANYQDMLNYSVFALILSEFVK
ncbi:DUF1599 domain-containing protein [Marinigracilibium pacificum]|uniref:DUF1599 domain-containing protein n=1 Tax=Marinigracilibium pacificum TaxID=2729599 RepID=A0A848IZL9_9BACT|nr:DUF1599 domain-containing protein [Marinigracilibium pacificum]NMM48821.1 DUF1599 domain-containing protein [Marinigracilibium pacificum]